MLAISLIVYTIFAFLMACSFSSYDVDLDKYDELKKPSVYDLDDDAPRYIIERYVNTVIEPANNYFTLKKDLEKNNEAADYFGLVMYLGLPFTVCELALKQFYNSIFDSFWKAVLIVVITLVVCFLIAIFTLFVSDFINKHSKLTKLIYISFTAASPEDLKNHFDYKSNRFPISDERALMNFVIQNRYEYLLLIQSSVKRSKACKIAAAVFSVSAFLILLFISRN